MKNIKLSILFLLTISLNTMFAQIPAGKWRVHLPFSKATMVADAEDKVYCAGEVSLFSYNKYDGGLEPLSRVNGLSGIEIGAIKYDYATKILVIGYKDGNIDLIQGQNIYNLADIARKQLFGIKSVNNITFTNDKAYLACGFGIVVLNLLEHEIADSYFIGDGGIQVAVNEVASDGKYLYAATDNGIYLGNLNGSNLLDYRNWTKFDASLPNYDKKFNTITYFNGKIYANYRNEITKNSDQIYVYDGVNWKNFESNYSFKYNRALISDPHEAKLLIINNYYLEVFDKDMNNTNHVHDYFNGLSPAIRYATFDKDGTLWIADNNQGLLKNEGGWQFESFAPNGPGSNSISDISISGGRLWATNSVKRHIYSFINEQWKTYNQYTTGVKQLTDFQAMIKVLVNPQNPEQVYIGSDGYGLAELSNNQIVGIYNNTNSGLQRVERAGGNMVKVTGMALDQNKNLWIANSWVSSPIVAKTPSGEWFKFGRNLNIDVKTKIVDILITDNNHIWTLLIGGSIAAYDYNSTLEDNTDDRMRKISIKAKHEESITDAFAMAKDLDGTIWVGTDVGAINYNYPEDIFDSTATFYADQVTIQATDKDQVIYRLLETETVSAIAIDGGNRKWFGTGNAGVFLMSDDCTEELLHFTESNSPLLSNSILKIEIDDITGEVFFATENGIISYKGNATAGDDDFNDVFVYPNPVRENFEGMITIRGLVTDVDVKITDITGNLVYETTAQGGEATWDGKTFDGNKVHTGIYLVLCSNEDGSKTFVTKILFIN